MASKNGSSIGKKALAFASRELAAGAGEMAGNNRGPFVKKYLAPLNLVEGNPWCAAFVSWCFLQACGDSRAMPFRYSASARGIFSECRKKGWLTADPMPGDLIAWTRGPVGSGKGHIGFVEKVQQGFLQTIEGNRTSKVERFQYESGRIEKLLGFIRIPNNVFAGGQEKTKRASLGHTSKIKKNRSALRQTVFAY
jgi:hypothetical protein